MSNMLLFETAQDGFRNLLSTFPWRVLLFRRRLKMKAIFVTGGKQYYVEEGSTIYVEKLPNEVGSEVEFNEVLFVNGKAGNPTVKNAKVVGVVEKQGKNKKIIVFKYHPKKKYRKKQGHRQPYTKVTIKSIVG